MDALVLARMQFAANISFHILFPTISIALGWVLLYFRLRWLKASRGPDPLSARGWLDAYRFWTKVFALSFALGVVSGITMSFQFGTNWPGFMEKVGNIAGPLLGYEVLTAFFLEAGFLGIMLFGSGKVSERVHLAATALVAFGTTLSAFWILALNSWMQTPAGYEIVDGVYHVKSWVEVVFNPSFPYRFAHMLLASALTGAFLMAGLSAWQVLKGVAQRSAPRVLRTGLTLAAIAIPVQIFVGDMHGLNTLHHQPAKIAAMEGVWDTERGAPLLLFAIPDATERRNHLEVKIPKLASLILTHDLDGEIKGLNSFGDAHPPPLPLFFAFRAMVGIGMAMLATSWLGWWWYRRVRWRPEALPRPLLWLLAGMTFSGWGATLAGWYVTEIGRQPFVVYGLVRTADVVSKVPSAMIGLTLVLYLAMYAALIVAYIGVLKYMAEKPEEVLAADAVDQAVTPAGAITPPLVVGMAPVTPLSFDTALPVVFMVLMGVSMLVYVVSDGYDLGVGMLMHRATAAEKDVMIASIGPFWDANETWLVLGVGILLIAFPKAHGLVLGELYLPVTLMLIGLSLRGVAFDFRVKARDSHKTTWDRLFFAGSTLASASQGWMLGRYVSGFGTGWNYPVFAAAIAIALPMAYVLMGATWLIMKTEGELQERAVGWARTAWAPMVAGLVLISMATPWISTTVRERWFSLPEIIALMAIPLMTGVSLLAVRALLNTRIVRGPVCWLPFVLLILVFVLGFLGLAYSIYPYVVIDQLTIWQAASSPEALKVILVGVCISVPAIAGYTVFSYRVFRGKAGELTYA